MRGQVKINQSKLAARRRRRVFLLSLYSFAAIVLLMCGLSYVSELDSLSIDRVAVRGNERLSSSTVEALVRGDLAGNYGWLFSKRDFVLYPRAQIAAHIRALPIVKSANVGLDGIHTIDVSIVERSESARWCMATSTDCYSVDDSGFIFAPAPRATSTDPSAPTDIEYRGLVSTNPIGEHILDEREFKKISFFMNELAGLSVEPREVVLTDALASTSTDDIYMDIYLKDGGRLVVDASDDLSTVLGNIAAVISDKVIVPSLSDFLAKLDYMKLDVGNKVVYKLKR